MTRARAAHVEVLPENGLTLVVEPWGPADVAALHLWIPVGSAFEPPGLEGAAHLLEHLVFRGAGERPGPQLTADVEALGGDLNAWTSVEQTTFHVTVPVAAAVEGVRAIADLAFRPWLRGRDLRAERPVVLEEIRGAEDDPGDVLAEAMRARAWGPHPYGRPVLGTPRSVRGIRLRDLQAFHARWYRPERAVLAVAGPVDLDALRAAAAGLRAARPASEDGAAAPAPPPRSSPARPGGQLELIDRGFAEHRVEVAFWGPGPLHADAAALDLLAVALGGGPTSRLFRRLRLKDDLVLSIFVDAAFEQDGCTVVVAASCRPGQAGAVVEAVADELERLCREGPTADELRRARTSVMADRLTERETVDGRANRLGWYQLHAGGPDGEDDYERQIAAVDPARARAVARAWLHPGRAQVGLLCPATDVALEPLQARWSAAGAAVDAAVPAAAPPGGARAAGPRGDGVVRLPLACGARLVVEPHPGDGLVGVAVQGFGGSGAEPEGAAGLAEAWSELLLKGAGERDADAFARELEARMGGAHAWVSRSAMGLQLSVPPAELDAGLGLLADLLRAPRFDADELERARSDLRAARDLVADDPEDLAWELCWSGLYPNHAWGRPQGGTLTGISRITRGGLRGWHKARICGANLVIGVAGDVDPAEVQASLDRALAGLAPGAPTRPSPPAEPGPPRRRRARVPRADAAAQIVLGLPGPGVGQPGATELRVVEALLAGATGAGGRLFQALREDRGLAYEVGAAAERGFGAGAFFLHIATDPGRVREARRGLRAELERLRREPVGAAELERVRRGLVDGAALGLQRAVSRAEQAAGCELWHGDGRRWRDRLRLPLEVGAEQILEVARHRLDPARAVEVTVGPAGAW